MKDYAKQNSHLKAALKAKEITKTQYKNFLKDYAQRNNWFMDNIGALSKDLVQVDKKAMEMVRNEFPSVLAINYNYATYTIEKVANMSTNFTLIDETTAKILIDQEPSLIGRFQTDEVKDLSWNRKKITSAITQGVLQGESIPEIAQRIATVGYMDMRNATKAARTAMTCAQNMGRIKSYRRAEAMGIELKKMWIATLDGRTRDTHRQLDGVAIGTDEEFDNGLLYPADPSGDAAEVSNCRCTLIAQVGSHKYDMSDRASKLEGLSYEDWKKGLNNE